MSASVRILRRLKPEEISTRDVIRLAYLSQGVLLALNLALGVVFLSKWFSMGAWRDQMREVLIARLSSWSASGVVGAVTLAVGLLVLIEIISYHLVRRLGKIPGYDDYFIIESWRDRWRMAPAGILAGINEELLFRGLLFSYLMAKWPHGIAGSNQWVWILTISVGFGLLHSYQGVTAILPTTVIGVLMFVLLLMTQSLIVPMVCHATYDVLAFLVNADLPSTRLAMRTAEARRSY